ncbi:MAG TPA: hypothetical protein VIL94_07405 [Acidothermaceae bacterium]
MSTETVSTDVRDYLAAVMRELADLPPAERDDLLDDLDDHLHEVLAEGEGSLEQRLGPPAMYAAELRTSAGLASSTTQGKSTAGLLHRAIDAMSSSTIWRRTAEHGSTRATLDFLPQLRPAWWILRAWLAVEFIAAVQHPRYNYGFRDDLGLIPRIAGVRYWAVLLLLVAVPMSIAIGRRSHHGGTRLLVLVGNLLAVATIVPATIALHSTTYVENQVAPQDGLFYNGHPITNIYPYDANGHPLDHVRLFDSGGQPITPVPNMTVLDGLGQGGVAFATAPAVPTNPSNPNNDYPMPNVVTVYGDNGAPTTAVLPRPSFTVAPLPSASASPTPDPSQP